MHQYHSPSRSSKPSSRRERMTRFRTQSSSQQGGLQPPFSNHGRSVLAQPDQSQQQGSNTTMKPEDMSQMLLQLDYMMNRGIGQWLPPAGLDHTANSPDSTFSSQGTSGVFSFPDSFQSTSTIPNPQTSSNHDAMTDMAGSVLFDKGGIPPNPAPGYHCSGCCCFNSSSNSSGSARTKAPRSKAEPISLEESLASVTESVQDAGFKDMDDMILSYYTTRFDEDSYMFQEQRMSRKRGLPIVLSGLSNSAASWNAYEREGYQTQVLKSAESLLVDECQQLFASLAFKERLAGFRSGAVHTGPIAPSTLSIASSSSTSYPLSSGSSRASLPSYGDSGLSSINHSPASDSPHPGKLGQVGTPDLRYWLIEELPNVWKLISSLSGCRPGSQPVATVLLTMCLAHHFPADEVRLLLQSVVL